MAWYLQVPGDGGPKLIEALNEAAAGASSGGAAFAFATAKAVEMFFASPNVQATLTAGQMTLIVGLDAITDTAAIQALSVQAEKYPNLTARAFKNTGGGAFHPKTVWFAHDEGGVLITGSGNLTTGGLHNNWEAFDYRECNRDEMEEVCSAWDAWLSEHADSLLTLDDEAVVKAAAENRRKRSLIRRTLVDKKIKGAVDEDEAKTDEDIEAETTAEIVADDLQKKVLVAEVPRSGDRWKQVNFDLETYQNYFGVKLGTPKTILLYQMNPDGTLEPPEDREAVAVKSQNYRFEIGAASGLDYPPEGNPILIFENQGPDTFTYALLMPGNNGHDAVQAHLNSEYARRGNQKLRVQMTKADLSKAWPENPFML